MEYKKAENYILSFFNFPKREYMIDSNHCSLYLERLNCLLKQIDSPELKIPHYIHITGTSGKGSLTAFIRSILFASGKNTGSITSPHPSTINERYWFNGHFMVKKEFAEISSLFRRAIDRYLSDNKYEMFSFYELTEAIGLYYLAKKKVNWAVLEAGCGGRYDSSNIIPRKDIAVITNIGLDHTDILGKTKEKIALEKAGIIKKGAEVFSSEQDESCLRIIRKECLATKTNLNIVNCQKYKIINADISGTEFEYKNNKYKIKLLGEHQVKNAVLAIEVSRSLGINEKSIYKGLKKAFHPLSMEVISTSPIIILDGAHNNDKIKTGIQTIRQLFGKKNVDLVVGFSDNKNIGEMVKSLSQLNLVKVAITRNTMNHIRLVAEPYRVKKEFEKNNIKKNIQIFSDPQQAFEWVNKNNKQNIKLVTGSIFLSGEIRGNIIKL
jgi:dihydrofolate synthase/folylpolyglutamate synthase